MLPGITPAVAPRRFEWPDATWIGQADSTALIGGGSPLAAGMEVIALGSAFNGSGTDIVVNVPSGWTNHRYIVRNVSPNKSAIGMWSKKLTGSETPDFFTNHSQAQMHFYGYRNGGSAALSAYSIPFIVAWGQYSDTGDPSWEFGNLSSIGSKSFLIVGAFRATGTISDDTITYNSADQSKIRNANSQTNNYLVSRINYVPRVSSISSGNVTFDMGDAGNASMFIGIPFTIG